MDKEKEIELYVLENRFFARLDLRLFAFANILEAHEKYMVGCTCTDKKKLDKYNKDIDDFNKSLREIFMEQDCKLKDFYDDLERRYKVLFDKESDNDI